MYAQMEDPAQPGFFESLTCTVLLNKQALGFTYAKDLKLMNYNGDRSLKAGSEGVDGQDYLKLIESDQAGEGKPWLNLMTEDQDDT